MKTVMKKLLSVALAAILLVSAVPFQASAAEVKLTVHAYANGVHQKDLTNKITIPDSGSVTLATMDSVIVQDIITTGEITSDYVSAVWTDMDGNVVTTLTDSQTEGWDKKELKVNFHYHVYDTGTITTQPTCGTEGVKTRKCTLQLNGAACTATKFEDVDPTNNHNWKETSNTATCTAAGVKTYTCQNVNCDVNGAHTKTEGVAALGHDWTDWTVSGDNITRSCKRSCGAVETKSAIVTFVNKLNNTTTTAKVGDTYALPSLPFVSGYRAVGWAVNGEYKSGNLTLTDDMSGQTFYAYYENTQVTDSNTVKVYLKLRVGSEDAGYSTKQTIELDSFDLLSTDNLLDALKSRSANYDTTVKNSYSAYTWNGVFYNNNGNVVATDNATNADGTKSVFIRADRKQADVIVHVYNDNTKTEYKQYTLNYQAPGEAVNIASIKQLLSDNKVSYSTVKMYTYEGWKNFKNGKSNTSTNDITVSTDNSATHIYVYLTKGTSKADSTNPKTGDMIFIPAMVMLASAAAVAYIYMGTKKRTTR